MSMERIASLAGVSHVTVSRVVNNRPGVSASTAQRVKQAMREVGYVPRPRKARSDRGVERRGERAGLAARHLAMVVVDNSLWLHASFLQKMFGGVESAASEAGCGASMVWLTDIDRAGGAFERGNVDGVLLVGRRADDEVMARLARLPAVWLTSHADVSTDAVLLGNEAVGALAARYLAERGHQRVAFLNAEHDNPSYRVRGESFEAAARSEKLKFKSLVSEPEAPADEPLTPRRAGLLRQLEERVGALVDQWLKQRHGVTGLFVPSDLMTAVVYRKLAERGVRIGAPIKSEGVEIVSCDNEEAYLMGLHPRPATIDVGAEVRGRRAVEQLLWRIRNPRERRGVQLAIEPLLLEPDPTPPNPSDSSLERKNA
ncbi:MAG: LacI family DNA-binding transcriptional regulator [Planctomycetota bacterium]